MKRILSLSLILVFTSFYAFSQISIGGEPYSFKYPVKKDVPEIHVPALDMNQVQKEDEADAKMGAIPKIARAIEVNYNLNNSGEWINLNNGDRLWRLKLSSKGALGLITNYTKFYLPEGSLMYVYSADGTEIYGGFSAHNNHSSGEFATGIIHSNEIIFEYFEPAKAKGKGSINISDIGYVYRGVPSRNGQQKDFGDSDPCQININCSPEGNNWQSAKRGAVRILVREGSSYGWCSGSLVNNVRQDCKPYVLLALHCGRSATAANMNQWVFYFNYEAPTCAKPSSQGNLAGQSMTGCVKRADSDQGGSNLGSDFFLMELNNAIPASYNAYLNGWNANTAASTGGVSIHHPAGDIKKISTFTGTLVSATWSGSPSNAHWRVTWAATQNGHGVTEGGSSGSPLFDNNKRIIGTLTGGSSYCNTPTQPDLYGKMSYHWTSNGTTAAKRLKNWLDPDNTGVLTLDGIAFPCSQNQPPVADFVANVTTIPVGGTVNFTDLSTNSPTSWSWNFGNGGTSTQQNPSRTYNAVGQYTVSLTTTNSSGSNTATKNNYINVVAGSGSNDCDTLTNISATDQLTVYGLQGQWGLFPGHNGYNMQRYADKHYAAAPNYVQTLLVPVFKAHAGTANSTVVFRIYANNAGTPGSVLGSQTVNISTLVPFYYNFVDFATPVAVNGDFFVGFEISYANADTFAVYTAADRGAGGLNTAWAYYGGSWYDVDALFGNNMKTSLGIEVLLGQNAAKASFTASSTTVCTGESINLNGTGSQNASSYYWAMQGGTPASSQSSTTSVSYNTPGTYNIKLYVEGGCKIDSMITAVTVSGGPTVTLNKTDATCSGMNDGTASVTVSGGTQPYSYTWSNGATTSSVSNLAPGSYTVLISDGAGCSKMESVTILSQASSSVSISSNQTICAGQSATVTASATGGLSPYNYVWSNGSNGPSITVSPNVPTTYTVTVTDANGCTSANSTNVNVVAVPVTTASPDQSICKGQSVTLTASGGSSYFWSTGAQTASITVSPTSNISYSVQAVNGNCQGNIVTINISVESSPTSVANASPTLVYISQGATVNFSSAGSISTSYLWNFGDGNTSTQPNPTHTYTATGIYNVVLTTTLGNCTHNDTVEIEVLQDVGISKYDGHESLLIYPNPSIGAINIEFKKGIHENTLIRIFNGIGEVISETNVFPQSDNKFLIDLSNKAKGLYYIQVINQEVNLIRKITIIK
jgi:lysyl endopeptidase